MTVLAAAADSSAWPGDLSTESGAYLGAFGLGLPLLVAWASRRLVPADRPDLREAATLLLNLQLTVALTVMALLGPVAAVLAGSPGSLRPMYTVSGLLLIADVLFCAVAAVATARGKAVSASFVLRFAGGRSERRIVQASYLLGLVPGVYGPLACLLAVRSRQARRQVLFATALNLVISGFFTALVFAEGSGTAIRYLPLWPLPGATLGALARWYTDIHRSVFILLILIGSAASIIGAVLAGRRLPSDAEAEAGLPR